jgi:hypothetical protein
MYKKHYIKNSIRTLVAGMIAFACLPSAHSQTIIFHDTFPGSGNLDSESTSGITGVDSGAGGALPQSDGQELTTDGLGDLSFGATSSNHADWARFDTIGSASTFYNWATGAGASDITAAGGFTLSFNWIPTDTTSTSWLFFVAGTNGTDNSTSGGPIFNSATSGGIFFTNNGTVQAYDSDAPKSSGSFTPTLDNAVSLTYAFTSYAAGAPVTLVADVNGVQVLTDSFTWNSSTNYMDLGSYQESNQINSLQVATVVPEPGSYGIAVLGLSTLLVWHRVRGGKRLAV